MLANPGLILVEGDIADPMDPVFNRPVIAVQIENPCGWCFSGGKTGDSVSEPGAEFPPLQIGGVSMNQMDDPWELASPPRYD